MFASHSISGGTSESFSNCLGISDDFFTGIRSRIPLFSPLLLPFSNFMKRQIYVSCLCSVTLFSKQKTHEVDPFLKHRHQVSPIHKDDDGTAGRVSSNAVRGE